MHLQSWRDLVNGPGFRSSLRGASRYFFGKRGQRRVRGLRIYYRLRVMILLKTGEPVGKLARRSDVYLWVDGSQSFRRLAKLIRSARHHIFIQMFIWKNDATGRRLAQQLIEAADRGVIVDITKEAVGDFFEFHGDFLSTKGSQQEPWKTFWHHPRIRIHYATSNDHTKVFIFDDHILLLTGMNIADEYRYHWHDYMVELRGTQFVEQFLTRTKKVSSVLICENDLSSGKTLETVIPFVLQKCRVEMVDVLFTGYFSEISKDRSQSIPGVKKSFDIQEFPLKKPFSRMCEVREALEKTLQSSKRKEH